jgi:hypothetical protein
MSQKTTTKKKKQTERHRGINTLEIFITKFENTGNVKRKHR